MPATVQDPAYLAFVEAQKGRPYATIAEELGYADAASCEHAVLKWLQRSAAEQGPEVRRLAFELSTATYQAVKSAWWGRATGQGHRCTECGGGHLDKDAAAVVMKAQERLDKLHRFGEPGSEEQGGVQAIIIPTGDNFVSSLRKLFLEQAGISQAAAAPELGPAVPAQVLNGLNGASAHVE